MKRDKAFTIARKRFGPTAYVLVIRKVAFHNFVNPYRVGVLDERGNRCPLGAGVNWRQAIANAKIGQWGVRVSKKGRLVKGGGQV